MRSLVTQKTLVCKWMTCVKMLPPPFVLLRIYPAILKSLLM